jgi:hypothetical protein
VVKLIAADQPRLLAHGHIRKTLKPQLAPDAVPQLAQGDALAIDSVVGGGKIRRQADAIGWPCVFPVESVTDEALQRAFSYCLTSEARERAKNCASRAREEIENVRATFIEALGHRA